MWGTIAFLVFVLIVVLYSYLRGSGAGTTTILQPADTPATTPSTDGTSMTGGQWDLLCFNL